MRPGLRKLALTAHVTSSVGWLGAVAAFLALAIVALVSADDQQARAASIAMKLIGWLVIVPFSVASFASGVIQSLGTTWGLFRHYWIVAKLAITVGASVLLLLHMQVVDSIALAASADQSSTSHWQGPRMQAAADAAAALVVLLIAAALSVYKPPGRIDEAAPRWVRVVGAVMLIMIVAFVMRHALGSSLASHF